MEAKTCHHHVDCLQTSIVFIRIRPFFMAGAKMAGVKILGAFSHQNRKNRSLCGCRKQLVRKKTVYFRTSPEFWCENFIFAPKSNRWREKATMRLHTTYHWANFTISPEQGNIIDHA
jgi:hypothetical protein